MTGEQKIRMTLLEHGLIAADYDLRWVESGCWRLAIGPKIIYASCARTMIRAIRRRLRR